MCTLGGNFCKCVLRNHLVSITIRAERIYSQYPVSLDVDEHPAVSGFTPRHPEINRHFAKYPWESLRKNREHEIFDDSNGGSKDSDKYSCTVGIIQAS